MSDWRELFGFKADERPSYELVHDRYAERVKALTNDQRALSEWAELWDRPARSSCRFTWPMTAFIPSSFCLHEPECGQQEGAAPAAIRCLPHYGSPLFGFLCRGAGNQRL